jgi:hypothetical protein
VVNSNATKKEYSQTGVIKKNNKPKAYSNSSNRGIATNDPIISKEVGNTKIGSSSKTYGGKTLD